MWKFCWRTTVGHTNFKTDHDFRKAGGNILDGVSLFIGTHLVTSALSCVHSAFASCQGSFEKEESVSCSPVLSDPFHSFGVHHTSAALHPPLKADCSQPWGPSYFLLRPSGLIPSNYLHTPAILRKEPKQKENKTTLTYISFLLLS